MPAARNLLALKSHSRLVIAGAFTGSLFLGWHTHAEESGPAISAPTIETAEPTPILPPATNAVQTESLKPAIDTSVFVPPAPLAEAPPQPEFFELPPPPLPLPSDAAQSQNLVPPLPTVENEQVQPGRISDEEWVITITPMEKPKASPLISNYQAVYASIPFRRAEYLANPSYRHDTTVEMLFGQMRPTVINRTDSPQRVVNPRPQLTQPYPISKGELYSYWPLLQYGSPLPLLSPIR